MSRTPALASIAALATCLAALVAAPPAAADVSGPPVPDATTLIALVVAGLVTLGVLVASILILRRIALRTGQRAEQRQGRAGDEPSGEGPAAAAPPPEDPRGATREHPVREPGPR